MKQLKFLLITTILLAGIQNAEARQPDKDEKPAVEINESTFINLREDCAEARESTDLEINNVRARLWVGGDVWWDKSNGRYIVPKPPVGSDLDEVSSLFAGGVWLGGFDPNGNLKVAASTYPQGSTTDYYPGPLDSNTGLTDQTTCQEWDEFFKVDGDNIRKAIRAFDNAKDQGVEFSIDSVSSDIRFWPGQGNIYFEDEYGFPLPNTEAGLGAFWDQDGDQLYSPENGDFPIIDIRGCEPATRKEAQELVPDEMIFWIYNDAGNIHRESGASTINMEVQVQAFAYATNDEINDMTFLRYKLINRAEEDIRQTYFAMWVDPDLGCSEDDYSGCDVGRSLAYTYNQDELDGSVGINCGGVATYKAEVPIIGTDYFRGPIAPKVVINDSGPCTDGAGDTHVIRVSDRYNPFLFEIGDTICIRDPDLAAGEIGNFGFELGMSSFLYYNRGGFGNPDPATVDPQTGPQFYNYLEGKWLNGEPLTIGGTGLNPGSTDTTRYAFTDPPNLAGGWSMFELGLGEGDRRTLQASGPFLLTPNAVNELIVGAVWVPNVPHPGPDIITLTTADDIAQNLFDNCFDIIDGPDAPTICPVELDGEVILVLHNDLVESNNANLAYSELDIRSNDSIPEEERTYVFEGYKIYQLVNSLVSPQELDDIDKARLVRQVDLNNGITEIYNWTSSRDPNAELTGNPNFLWTPVRQVMGADEGIQNTFRITTDAFTSGGLINHTKYYYMAVAYAHNEYAPFDPRNSLLTQANPYLEGRGNVQTYEVTPRPIVYTGLNAAFGDGAKVTRLQGIGAGGNVLDVEDGTHDAILSGNFDGRIEYKEGAGPIDVKIYNPLEVRNGKFQLEIIGEHDSGSLCELEEGATWRLTDLNTDMVIESEGTIDEINEQLIPEYGFSLNIRQSDRVGSRTDSRNGALSALTEYAVTEDAPWFTAVREEVPNFDDEFIGFGRNFFNFIRTGSDEPDEIYDPNQAFSNLGDGYWYPFKLTAAQDPPGNGLPYVTPAWNQSSNEHGNIRNDCLSNLLCGMNNVDIVMTSDKSKWSRCIVVETGSKYYELNTMLDLKVDSPSKDKEGMDEAGSTGFSWFPGYAIDVETGQRLNIFFGENSVFNAEYSAERDSIMPNRYNNGDDMLYNPTSDYFSVSGVAEFNGISDIYMGGQHFIYVTRQGYDGCQSLRDEWETAILPFFAKINIYKAVTWCSMSMVEEEQEILSYADGVVPNDVTFKLRVDSPYNLETDFRLGVNGGCPVVDPDAFPLYEFEILGKEPNELAQEDYEGALANVRAVPNPYYAFSSYENTQLDKTIKITNVPDRAIVTIYSLDGKFIKQFNRDERSVARLGANPGVRNSQTSPEIEWDLENSAGIPVSSGVYLIHIAAPELGEERTIKWFGVNRKFDPAGF